MLTILFYTAELRRQLNELDSGDIEDKVEQQPFESEVTKLEDSVEAYIITVSMRIVGRGVSYRLIKWLIMGLLVRNTSSLV